MLLLQLENATNQASYLLTKARDIAIEYAPKLIGAILIYLIGSWIIKKLSAVIERMLTNHNYDPSLKTFFSPLLHGLLTVLLFLAVFQKLGIETISFTAILACIGLGIVAAFNGFMVNFGRGVTMLLFKPFRVGDLMKPQTQAGIVLEQGIFNMITLTPDNKTVILPNSTHSTGTISNYTTPGNLKIDVKMAVELDVNIDKARQVAVAAMKTHPKVLDTPSPEVSVLEIGNGMIVLAIKPYTTQVDYWDVLFSVKELVKNAWDANGIKTPITS